MSAWDTYIKWREQYLKGNKMSEQNQEILNNLEVLRGMVVAHPQTLFDLRTFTSQKDCGTLFCTVGLAASQSFFQEKGLSLSDKGMLMIKGERLWNTPKTSKHLDNIFGENSFDQLFQGRNDSGIDREHPETITEVDEYGDVETFVNYSVTDKELALWRLDRAIEQLKGKQE